MSEWILAISFTSLMVLAVLAAAKRIDQMAARRAARRRNQARPWRW